MRKPQTGRERRLAYRIDAKAHEILASGQKWRPGVLEFDLPFPDLTPDEQGFVSRRIANWQAEVVRRNGREPTE